MEEKTTTADIHVLQPPFKMEGSSREKLEGTKKGWGCGGNRSMLCIIVFPVSYSWTHLRGYKISAWHVQSIMSSNVLFLETGNSFQAPCDYMQKSPPPHARTHTHHTHTERGGGCFSASFLSFLTAPKSASPATSISNRKV